MLAVLLVGFCAVDLCGQAPVPSFRRDVMAVLRGDGVRMVGPNEGDMACGEYGPGRMAEPAAIVAAMRSAREMTVSARDAAGRGFSNTWQLTGAATALDAAAVGCAAIR